jgi:NADPH:quinone reductase-like Zn-dependent oxidoreductase/acyl carrier protein
MSVVCGRVSYAFRLKGPSISVDTACSSSLVSLQLALTSLQSARAVRALNSGVNLTLVPDTPAMFQRAGMMSPEGRCKTLDGAADGYVRAEAATTALLQAVTMVDGEQPQGLVAFLRGAAVNQGGRSSTLTAPNGPSQQDVLRSALQAASVAPAEVVGLQMHGTGTPLGDPIEVGAAAAVFVDGLVRPPLTLMASKSWLGHAESGAGMVGVAHAAMAGGQAAALGLSHLRELNPYVIGSVAAAAEAWSLPRQTFGAPAPSAMPEALCGISSFAFQGTNAHALLQRSDGHATPHLPLQRVFWSKQYHWLAPAPHPMLHAATARERTTVALECWLSASPSLSYLWDHRVSDRVLLPGAGFFELAAAGLRLVLGSAAAGCGVAEASIPVPLRLPDSLEGCSAVLRCSLDLSSGKLLVASSDAAFKQPHLVAAGARIGWEMAAQAHGEAGSVASLGSVLLPTSATAIVDGLSLALVGCVDAVDCDPEIEQFNAAVLDGCLQLAAAAAAPGELGLKVPAGAGVLQCLDSVGRSAEASLWATCCGALAGGGSAEPLVMDFSLAGSLALRDLVAKSLVLAGGADASEGLEAADRLLYEVHWPAAEPAGAVAPHDGAASMVLPNAASPGGVSSSLVAVLQSCGLDALSGGQLATSSGLGGPNAMHGSGLGAAASAALVGVLRAAATELPSHHFGVADVNGASLGTPASSLQLLNVGEQLSCPAVPGGAALHGNVSHSALLVSSEQRTLSAAFQLLPQPRGALTNLRPAAVGQGSPGRGQAMLSVRAVGLNFRDVLNVLGMYPGDPGPPGGDCSGVVVGVGPGVSHLQVGDAAFGLAAGSLGSQVCAGAMGLVRMPSTLSFEAAASAPTVFVTVDAALHQAASMQPGEVILVHAAAGGVGLAALQVIGAAGCLAVATAGSPFKRGVVRARGVEAALNSRDTVFASEAAALGGADVVLNSLTSSGFVGGSLALLRRGGRFVEISKRDIWSGARVAQERPDVGYTLVAVDFLPPVALHRALLRLSRRLSVGSVHPLPCVAHGMGDVSAALRQMSQARHVGKIVVRSAAVDVASAPSDGMILVTGGLGALGSLTVAWLAETAVGVGVLATGRIGRLPAASGPGAVSPLLSGGFAGVLRFASADAAASEDAGGLMGRVGQQGLAGLIHAAGVLADATLRNQTLQRVRAVFGPKSEALQRLCDAGYRLLPACFEALFSSVASLLGSPGQSNYAAANAALDAMASVASQRGMRSVSVQWGAWSGAGMASSDASTRARVERTGLGMVPAASGLSALHALVLGGVPASLGASPVLAAVPFSWEQFISWQRSQKGTSLPTLYAEFVADLELQPSMVDTPAGGAGGAGGAVLDAVFVESQVQEAVAAVLGQSVGRDEPLMAAGLDSLGAVELSNSLAQRLGAQLPGTLVFDYPTTDALASYLIAACAVPMVLPSTQNKMNDDFSKTLDFQQSASPTHAIASKEKTSMDHITGITGVAGHSWELQKWTAGDAVTTVPVNRWDSDFADHHDAATLPPKVRF